jgi:hypothetical protein
MQPEESPKPEVVDGGFYRPPVMPQALPKSLGKQIIGWIEQPLFLLGVGLMAGFVGLYYPPILTVCGLCIVLAFHRQGVVSGQKWHIQLTAYSVVSALALGMVYGTKHIIIANSPHLPTIEEIIAGVQRAVGKQPNNVFPPPTTPPIVQPPPEQPFISVGQTSAEHDPDKLKTTMHLPFVNSSGVPTDFTVAFSATVDGVPSNLTTSNMPRSPVVIPPNGTMILNIYMTAPTEEIDKAIWDGRATLDVTANVKYAKRSYKYVGRLNSQGKYVSTLVSESPKVKRR